MVARREFKTFRRGRRKSEPDWQYKRARRSRILRARFLHETETPCRSRGDRIDRGGAAKVARDIPERVEIVGIAASSKARELAAQANELRPGAVASLTRRNSSELRTNLNYKPEIFRAKRGCARSRQKWQRHGANCHSRHGWIASALALKPERSRGGEQEILVMVARL